MPATTRASDPPLKEQPIGAPAASAFRDVGVYPNPAVREAIIAMYDAKLGEWPVEHHELDLPARYGTAHVVVAGHEDAPPLIFLHMAAASSFIWSPIIASLAARYRTYAIDIIGDVNKSVLADGSVRARNGAELADWVCEVSDALEVDRSDVIAGSYGGWLGMHYASRAPERVRRLALVVPMGLPGWTQTLNVLVRLATIQLGFSDSKIEGTLSYVMGDNPAARRLAGDWFTEILTTKCRMNAPQPWPVPNSMLNSLRMPTLIILGGCDSLIGSAERAARRARKHLPRVEIEIVPNGTHAVHMEEPTRVATRILDFFAHA